MIPVTSALRLSPREFANEMRVAAEIAGISYVEFLNELRQRRVPAIQVTADELEEELALDW